jgi:methylmalonyl-CoA mutase N-terminal domain/subunit
LIEYLTDEIEQRVVDYIHKIDEMGGALKAIERGYIQGEIQDAAYQAQLAVEKGEQVVVGVNAYQSDEKITLERLKVDPAVEQSQREALQTLRNQRDSNRVSELLNQLEAAAQGKTNLMPLFIECVENNITLGEICKVLRQVFGEYHPPAWV